jgi:hypothetical protein
MEEGPMKKSGLLIVILGFLVFSLAGISYGWQGRMGGMGDPYGLVQDESDFLIHPAGIANGKGINFYSNYRFTFRDVTDWNYSLWLYNHNGSGDEREHEALVGAAFPVGAGRMGLFFQYSGRRDNYGGDILALNIFPIGRYGMDSDLDAFALRLLYGLPMGGFKLGGEIQLAYRHERNDINSSHSSSPYFLENYPVGGVMGLEASSSNLFPFMRPYDSKYWEAIFKGSLEGMIGPVKMAFTLRGGFILTGDNNLMWTAVSSSVFGFNLDGNVKGWNIGGDLWAKYPIAEGLSLPFLLRVDYQKKTRDGDGPGVGLVLAGGSFDYKNIERNFQLEVGGGVDKEFGKGTRIAAGIYYGFLQNKNDYFLSETQIGSLTVLDYSKYPDQTEHRVILRIAGEREISSMVAMRIGLNFFYGWVNEDYNVSYLNPSFASEKESIDGSHWGIMASLGGTVKFQRFSFEPFLCGGYQKWDLDGNGSVLGGGGVIPLNMDKMRKEWLIGGGFSIKF